MRIINLLNKKADTAFASWVVDRDCLLVSCVFQTIKGVVSFDPSLLYASIISTQVTASNDKLWLLGGKDPINLKLEKDQKLFLATDTPATNSGFAQLYLDELPAS